MRTRWMFAAIAAAALLPGAVMAASAQPAQARIRYIERNVPAAANFYVRRLGFKLIAQSGPYFAMLSRGPLTLVLSPPMGPGGASKPMLNGQHAQPGGWNRMILQTNNLGADMVTLKKAGVHFRNNIAKGPGGSEVLLDDPSGNPVELFQPG